MVRADQEHAFFVAALVDRHRFRPAGRRRPVGGYQSLRAAALVDRRSQGRGRVQNIAGKSSIIGALRGVRLGTNRYSRVEAAITDRISRSRVAVIS